MATALKPVQDCMCSNIYSCAIMWYILGAGSSHNHNLPLIHREPVKHNGQMCKVEIHPLGKVQQTL